MRRFRSRRRRLPSKKKFCPFLEITCFGTLRLKWNGKPLTLKTKKAGELLALLACEGGGPVTKRRAASLLWGEAGPEQAMDSLSKVCRSLRDLFCQGEDKSPLLLTYSDISLDPARFLCDLAEFDRCLAAGDLESLGKAAALHTGELLTGESYEWTVEYAARYEIAFLRGCEKLAGHYRLAGWEKLARQYEKFLE